MTQEFKHVFYSHADAAENAEAHLLPLVLASGMYAFGAADLLRAFAMQPILRKSAVSA